MSPSFSIAGFDVKTLAWCPFRIWNACRNRAKRLYLSSDPPTQKQAGSRKLGNYERLRFSIAIDGAVLACGRLSLTRSSKAEYSVKAFFVDGPVVLALFYGRVATSWLTLLQFLTCCAERFSLLFRIIFVGRVSGNEFSLGTLCLKEAISMRLKYRSSFNTRGLSHTSTLALHFFALSVVA